MISRRSILRGLVSIAALGPLALKRGLLVVEEEDPFLRAISSEMSWFYDAVLREHFLPVIQRMAKAPCFALPEGWEDAVDQAEEIDLGEC